MITIKSSRIIYVDVDDTLIIPPSRITSDDEEYATLTLLSMPYDKQGTTQYFYIHKRHVDLMREFKARGHTIVVWSQGGWQWARDVVKKLQIENIVDVVMDKPSWYIDDLPASAFMGPHIYLHPTDPERDSKR